MSWRSDLVDVIIASPNRSVRTQKIDRITIHHMAGNLSVEQCGNIFANPARQASSNYGIGSDGRVGLYVDEGAASWCSSSQANDQRAITIEVANDEYDPTWHISDKALYKLVALCADICKRNGIKKLVYTGDTSGNLTLHKWFAATACPGPYIESMIPYIVRQTNNILTAIDGDANGDGKVNLNDTVAMMKFIAGWKGVNINEKAADVNHDGKVNMTDVVETLKKIASKKSK